MNILGKIFSSGATELVKGVGDVIDNFTYIQRREVRGREERYERLYILMNLKCKRRYQKDGRLIWFLTLGSLKMFAQ